MSALVIGQLQEAESSSKLPPKLLAWGCYPFKLRLNIYSKDHVIGTIASCLQGSQDMETIMRSKFGRLFELHVAYCHNSAKLINRFLCRQLLTVRKYELWFHFATHPLRFSLDEFQQVGLNCGAFYDADSEAENDPGSTMWRELFDTALGDITVYDVLKMLHNPFLAPWKHVPLALIVLVDGVICCSNKWLKLTPEYVEMLCDVEYFLEYLCGRESLLKTLPRLFPPYTSENPLGEMRHRLSQQKSAAYGFPLALRLFAFEASTDNFLVDPLACENTVSMIFVNDIVAVEEDPYLTIQFMPIPEAERYLWLDEATDERVTHLVCVRWTKLMINPSTAAIYAPSWIEQQFKQLASAFQKQIGELGEICAAVAVVYLKVNKVHTPSYADIEIHEVNEDANAVSPQFHRTDAVESTFKEQTPIPAAPLPKHFKDDEPVNVTWGESNPHMYNSGTKDTATDPATSGANPDCEVPVTSTTDEEGEEVDPNVRNPKPLSPIIEESECGTPAVGNVQTVSPSEDQNMVETSSLEDPNPGVVVEAVEHSSGSHVLDIDGRDFPMVDDPKKTVPIPARSPAPTGTPIHVQIDPSLQKEETPGDQPILCVYTPDARLKGLFKSDKKPEYKPLAKPSRGVFRKFCAILSENISQTFQIITSNVVTNSFFLHITEPKKWLSDEVLSSRMLMVDPYFTKLINSGYYAFLQEEDKLSFNWGTSIINYVRVKSRGEVLKKSKVKMSKSENFQAATSDSIISSSSTEQAVKCVCNLKTHPVRAWTRKNPGRRFVSCRGRRVGSQYVKCDFFQWVDQEPPHGWYHIALLEARDIINE
ncbi:BnaC06g02540D [Brassica napus]|uniref:BnaC06g02540D protein n=1 Tax=Brassica napus TaxID=3708 RepID=A0A078IB43_BRANA|nr:BnaC06g02540D [Brassica napus]